MAVKKRPARRAARRRILERMQQALASPDFKAGAGDLLRLLKHEKDQLAGEPALDVTVSWEPPAKK